MISLVYHVLFNVKLVQDHLKITVQVAIMVIILINRIIVNLAMVHVKVVSIKAQIIVKRVNKD
jgi:hypothetical protein